MISFQDEAGLTAIYKELSPQCFIISSQFNDFKQCQLQIDQSVIDGLFLQPPSLSSTVSQVFADVAKIEGKKKMNNQFLKDFIFLIFIVFV